MIDISLFGTTKVRSSSDPVWVDVAGVKPRQILEILAANLGRPVTKDVLAEGLWDGRPPTSYVASIESYVCVLRRQLSVLAGGSPLVTTHGSYLLDPDLVRVDLVEVRALLVSLQEAAGDALVRGAERALDLMTSDLLADDPFAAWADEIRQRLDDLVEVVVTRAAEVATARGHHRRAMRLARTVLERSQLSEPACRVLMSAHRAVDAPAHALSVYADLRRVMLDELGVEPSASTRGLYLAILEDADRCQPNDRDRLETGTLVRLLRQALESGVRLDASTRSWFAEVGGAVAQQSA